MDKIEEFKKEVKENISRIGNDADLHALSRFWVRAIAPYNYAYNFCWLGRPIIQFPQDIVAMQEIIWTVKPDLIIECGIAHGGSLIMSASILALIEYQDALNKNRNLDPKNPTSKVLGVDIDIRKHNKKEISNHAMASRIDMIEGSSISKDTIEKVHVYADGAKKILLFLDSNHTHNHVLSELIAYAPLVSQGSYCVVFDTLIEDMPAEMFFNRPWGKGDNPKTAVWKYIEYIKREQPKGIDGCPLSFTIDKTYENKLLITSSPNGFLKRELST